MVAKLNISKQTRSNRKPSKVVVVLLLCVVYGIGYSIISYQRMLAHNNEIAARYNFGRQVWDEELQTPFRSSQVKVADTHIYTGLNVGGYIDSSDKKVFLTFENPLYTATIAQEDFALKRTHTNLLQRMKKWGLRTLRYTNGQQEWRFDVP